MYNKIDLREVPAEKLKEISLDLVDIDAQAPEFEPNRQFYFMAKARDYVKRKSAELGRPMTFFTQTFGCPTDVIASGLSGSFVVTACNTAPKCFGRIMMINPTDLAKLNKIPDKRSRFLKRMIELPLVGTLLYHTLTGRSNIELLFTESYYHNPFHRSPEDVDAFYESAHLQSSAGKYLFASLAGNYVNLNIGHALKHIDNSIFLIGGEEEPGIAETFALYTALNTSIETQILPKTKHMPQMEAPQALLDQIQIFFAPVQ